MFLYFLDFVVGFTFFYFSVKAVYRRMTWTWQFVLTLTTVSEVFPLYSFLLCWLDMPEAKLLRLSS